MKHPDDQPGALLTSFPLVNKLSTRSFTLILLTIQSTNAVSPGLLEGPPDAGDILPEEACRHRDGTWQTVLQLEYRIIKKIKTKWLALSAYSVYADNFLSANSVYADNFLSAYSVQFFGKI